MHDNYWVSVFCSITQKSSAKDFCIFCNMSKVSGTHRVHEANIGLVIFLRTESLIIIMYILLKNFNDKNSF